MRRQVVSLLAGVLGLLVLASPALADGGRIAGRVLGGPEGAVLADARVELHRFESGTGGWQSQAVIRTAADGKYRFTGLAAGRYRVCAQSDAGIGSPNPEPLYLPRCWRAAATVDSADDIVLDPASMAASASIRLPRRGQVRGHVTDPGGAPVTGGYAQAFWNESGRWVPGPYALFDEEGNYELRLDSGRVYRVCFYPWEGQVSQTSAGTTCPPFRAPTAIRGVGPNRVVGGIDAELHTAGRIEGLIRGYPTGTQGSSRSWRFAGQATDGGRRDGTWSSPGRAPTRSRSTISRRGPTGSASAHRTSSSSPCSPASASAAPRRRHRHGHQGRRRRNDLRRRCRGRLGQHDPRQGARGRRPGAGPVADRVG